MSTAGEGRLLTRAASLRDGDINAFEIFIRNAWRATLEEAKIGHLNERFHPISHLIAAYPQHFDSTVNFIYKAWPQFNEPEIRHRVRRFHDELVAQNVGPDREILTGASTLLLSDTDPQDPSEPENEDTNFQEQSTEKGGSLENGGQDEKFSEEQEEDDNVDNEHDANKQQDKENDAIDDDSEKNEKHEVEEEEDMVENDEGEVEGIIEESGANEEGTNEHENEPGSTSCEDESKQHEGGSASRQASEDPNNIGSSWLPAHNTRAQSKLSGDMSTPTQLNNQPSRGTPQAPRLNTRTVTRSQKAASLQAKTPNQLGPTPSEKAAKSRSQSRSVGARQQASNKRAGGGGAKRKRSQPEENKTRKGRTNQKGNKNADQDMQDDDVIIVEPTNSLSAMADSYFKADDEAIADWAKKIKTSESKIQNFKKDLASIQKERIQAEKKVEQMAKAESEANEELQAIMALIQVKKDAKAAEEARLQELEEREIAVSEELKDTSTAFDTAKASHERKKEEAKQRLEGILAAFSVKAKNKYV